MLLEAAAYAVLGLAAALAAVLLLPGRLPRTPLTLATGPGAALAGGLLARSIFGAGRLEVTVPSALVFAVAMLSLLARPGSSSHLA